MGVGGRGVDERRAERRGLKGDKEREREVVRGFAVGTGHVCLQKRWLISVVVGEAWSKTYDTPLFLFSHSSFASFCEFGVFLGIQEIDELDRISHCIFLYGAAGFTSRGRIGLLLPVNQSPYLVLSGITLSCMYVCMYIYMYVLFYILLNFPRGTGRARHLWGGGESVHIPLRHRTTYIRIIVQRVHDPSIAEIDPWKVFTHLSIPSTCYYLLTYLCPVAGRNKRVTGSRSPAVREGRQVAGARQGQARNTQNVAWI